MAQGILEEKEARKDHEKLKRVVENLEMKGALGKKTRRGVENQDS